MKFTLGATIPVTQYGNLQPSIEIEANTLEEAEALVLPKIQEMWNRVCEPGRELHIKPVTVSGERITAFVGGEIDYDDPSHTYSWGGVKYLSGSEYAKQFEQPFDAAAIANRMGVKAGVDGRLIEEMWELNADVSRTFGDTLHKALELYGRFLDTSTGMEKEYHINKHPVIRKAVEDFYASHKGMYEHEIVVVDHDKQRAGRIDILLITGDKTCRVQDFKTNHEIDKHLQAYWEQLKFYGEIMEAAGWTVEGYDIFHFDGEWHDFRLDNDPLVKVDRTNSVSK